MHDIRMWATLAGDYVWETLTPSGLPAIEPYKILNPVLNLSSSCHGCVSDVIIEFELGAYMCNKSSIIVSLPKGYRAGDYGLSVKSSNLDGDLFIHEIWYGYGPSDNSSTYFDSPSSTVDDDTHMIVMMTRSDKLCTSCEGGIERATSKNGLMRIVIGDVINPELELSTGSFILALDADGGVVGLVDNVAGFTYVGMYIYLYILL